MKDDNARVPKILYKYLRMDSINDLDRLFDIVENNHIYFPRFFKLNDPLEGAGGNIEISPSAGMSLHIAADQDFSVIENKKSVYKILSLTENPVSPQMWAHYASNYKGICLCFSTETVFGKAKKVTYINDKPIIKAYEESELNQAVYNNFFYKECGWNYEAEWRIVCEEKEKTDDFFSFNDDDFKGMILGYHMPERIQEILVSHMRNKVKVIKAVPGYQNPKINLLPWNYKQEYNGERISDYYIKDICSYLSDNDD